MLDYIQNKQFIWWGRAKNERKKSTSKHFGTLSTWKKKKMKTSKFVGAGNNNWNDIEGN